MKYRETWRDWLQRIKALLIWETVIPADQFHRSLQVPQSDDLRDMQVIGACLGHENFVVAYNIRQPSGPGMVFMELNVDDPREAFELLTRDREQYANQNQARAQHRQGQARQ